MPLLSPSLLTILQAFQPALFLPFGQVCVEGQLMDPSTLLQSILDSIDFAQFSNPQDTITMIVTAVTDVWNQLLEAESLEDVEQLVNETASIILPDSIQLLEFNISEDTYNSLEMITNMLNQTGLLQPMIDVIDAFTDFFQTLAEAMTYSTESEESS
eukprot:TRINITY_DN9276_c1_g1_i4.p3 TRINITY_DN9276_c1_g1~~TRINITY_DN9276_c1_g1_i4.p3  ORF type:complete len:157 (-),score=16.33 TRINITY_DN9276_c1_g1_i4:296-766(-)